MEQVPLKRFSIKFSSNTIINWATVIHKYLLQCLFQYLYFNCFSSDKILSKHLTHINLPLLLIITCICIPFSICVPLLILNFWTLSMSRIVIYPNSVFICRQKNRIPRLDLRKSKRKLSSSIHAPTIHDIYENKYFSRI